MNHSIEDADDEEEGTDGKAKIQTSVKLFAIQKREVQRLVIKYSGNHSNPPPCSSIAASSQEDLLCK